MPESSQREQALAQIERDALRAGRVLTDLLALARASRTQMVEAAQPLDLAELTREVLAEFAQVAYASGHELALVSPGPFVITGHVMLLGLALRNLVENALTHTPRGTQVQVRLNPQARWVQVSDNAAGAPAQDAHAAAGPRLGPVVPGLGLGLGHLVVRKIADIHDARFEAVAPPPGFTCCYRLSLPAHE